jgi:hypothetical protein
MEKYMCVVKAKAIHSLNLELGIQEILETFGWAIVTMRYIRTNVALCKPCRPNIRTNIEIQNILDDPEKIEGLYL